MQRALIQTWRKAMQISFQKSAQKSAQKTAQKTVPKNATNITLGRTTCRIHTGV
jgi:hypothetical protein